MTLDILIATYGNQGIIRVSQMTLPPLPGVRYIVSWQIPRGEVPGQIPDSLKRKDIDIYSHFSTGVSRNRNFALSKATADYCLISDDDLIYTEESIRHLFDIFKDNPSVDIFAFKAECQMERNMPSYSFDLRHPPRFYWPLEFEIAFNLESIRRHKVRFNELFGRNAPILQSGEIAVFLHQAFKRNMTGRYFPLSLCSHPNPTTMEHMALNEGVIMAHGASIALIHPVTWLPRIIVNAYRRSRHLDTSFPQMLKLMLKGCIYRYRHISSDGSERR